MGEGKTLASGATTNATPFRVGLNTVLSDNVVEEDPGVSNYRHNETQT